MTHIEFLKVDTLDVALDKLMKYTSIETESIQTAQSFGRVASINVMSLENVPYFRRSSVDGYAVIAKDTAAATDSIPTFLKNKGYVEIGRETNISIVSGECVEVPTGGMIPHGADSVVMIEYTDAFADEITINMGVASGDNVVQIGDDIKENDIVLKKGTVITPMHIGTLMALGYTNIEVYKKKSITIFSTGTELVTPDKKAEDGKVRDINTYVLSSFAESMGYNVIHEEMLIDDDALIEEKLKEAMQTSDIVALSGGSSQGKKDNTGKIIKSISSPGILTQGLALKPGKPTILAYDEKSDTIIAGLPGQPMSAVVVFKLVLGILLNKLTNVPEEKALFAKISINVPTQGGKLTFVPCTIAEEEGYIATPILTKSANISTLSKLDGYILIGENEEGLNKGDIVKIMRL